MIPNLVEIISKYDPGVFSAIITSEWAHLQLSSIVSDRLVNPSSEFIVRGSGDMPDIVKYHSGCTIDSYGIDVYIECKSNPWIMGTHAVEHFRITRSGFLGPLRTIKFLTVYDLLTGFRTWTELVSKVISEWLPRLSSNRSDGMEWRGRR